MKPSSPIVPGANLPETVYAKDQPEYDPLPVFKHADGTVLSRWRLSIWERLRVLFTGNVYLWQLTFNGPLQPVMLEAERPKLGGAPLKRRWFSRWITIHRKTQYDLGCKPWFCVHAQTPDSSTRVFCIWRRGVQLGRGNYYRWPWVRPTPAQVLSEIRGKGSL